MKKINVLALAVLLSLTAGAQMQPGLYATGAAGINSVGEPLLSIGIHANFGRLYSGANSTPVLDGSTIYEGRVGVIMGYSICVAPYFGYGVQVRPNKFDGSGTKVSASPSKASTYGLLFTAPSAWEKTRYVVSIQFFDGKPALAAGLKLQLTNSRPCDR